MYEADAPSSMRYKWDDVPDYDPIAADGYIVEYDVYGAGGPYEVNPDSPSITLDGFSAVAYTSATWDLDGDGQYDDATSLDPIITLEYLEDDLAMRQGTRVINLSVDGLITHAALDLARLVEAGGPYSGCKWWHDEPLTLDGSYFYDQDPFLAAWDLDGDMDHDDAIGLQPTLTRDYLRDDLGLADGWHDISLAITTIDDVHFDNTRMWFPEPGTLSLLALGSLSVLIRRRWTSGPGPVQLVGKGGTEIAFMRLRSL